MAEDFGDLYDLANMSDDEVKQLILQELAEYPELDVDLIEIEVRRGMVTVSGRVGTEAEVQQVEQVLSDVIGVPGISNQLVVDELVRAELSEAADDAWVEDHAGSPQLAGGDSRTSDEASHLQENLAAEHFGTTVPQEAVERGLSYEPPTRPIQEGSYSREDH